MLKKVVAAAMLAGAAGMTVPAHADPVSVCYSVYIDIDGTVNETANCVP